MSAQRERDNPGEGGAGGSELLHEIVLRQALFRDVNERIGALATQMELRGPNEVAIVCECGDVGCTARIDLSQAEYEAVRLHPARFVVEPGHEIPAVERVVETREAYLVVEKIGDGAAAAARLDPRRRGSGDGAASPA